MEQQNVQVVDKPVINQRICFLNPDKKRKFHWVTETLERMGYMVEVIDYREERDKLGQLLQNVNADLVIVIRGEGIPPALIESLQCPTLLWYGEYIAGNDEAALARIREIRYNAAAFDYTIWWGKEETDALQVFLDHGFNRIEYFHPIRFDPAIYRKLDLPKIYDVSFVGTLTPRRKQILERLAKQFRVEFRNIWDVEELVRFFNQSKIVLHISFAPFITRTQLNLRVYDVVGSGTFMLTEDVVFHNILEDKKHLVYWRFNDIEDLVDKVRYYLTHEEEREKIAATGYEFLRENFTMERPIQDLLSFIDFSLRAPALAGKGYGVAFDKRGRQTLSMNELEKALEPLTSSGYPQSFYERAKLYYQLQQWEKSAELLEQALELNGHFVNAMYLLGLSYQRLQRHRDAARELRRLLKMSPLHAGANLALGEIYTALGDTKQATYYKQKGLKLTPRKTSEGRVQT